MANKTPEPRLRLSMADLPSDVLAAIGDITVAWGYVQNLMDVAIWGMLGLTVRVGNSLTAPFMYRGKMDMFQYVGREFFKNQPELLVDFKALATAIGDAYSKRNQVEHSTWQHFGPKDGPSLAVRIPRDASIRPQFKTAKDVDSVAQDIIKLVMSLNDFMERHIPPPRSSANGDSAK